MNELVLTSFSVGLSVGVLLGVRLVVGAVARERSERTQRSDLLTDLENILAFVRAVEARSREHKNRKR